MNFPEATACSSVASEIGFVKSIAPRNVHIPLCRQVSTTEFIIPRVKAFKRDSSQAICARKKDYNELFVKNTSHVIKPRLEFFCRLLRFPFSLRSRITFDDVIDLATGWKELYHCYNYD